MSFQQGLSGLNATAKNLAVIGNNIANSNTFGAKSSRAEFGDMYASALNGTGSSAVGIGTNLMAVAQQFTQGNIQATENPMDLAINGSGFFQVTDGKNPILYSRNGQFKVDREGFLVNNSLLKLVGYPADAAGVLQPGLAQPLQLPSAGIEPKPTSRVNLELNLDSRQATTFTGSTPGVDLRDPRTYNNSTSLAAYDAKGQDVSMTLFFQKAGNDTWNVYLTANGITVAGTDADPQPVTTLTFPSDGSAPNLPSTLVAFDMPATTNSVGALTVPMSGVQMNIAGVTQYGSGFGVTALSQDGYTSGQISSLAVEENGVVMARYSNGRSKPAGRLELATFRNPQGLQPLGNNTWARTFGSGDPLVGSPGEGTMGVLQSGALEESNVELTGELVNLITAQRIYQANAQTIKTEDQVLQTLVNMK